MHIWLIEPPIQLNKMHIISKRLQMLPRGAFNYYFSTFGGGDKMLTLLQLGKGRVGESRKNTDNGKWRGRKVRTWTINQNKVLLIILLRFLVGYPYYVYWACQSCLHVGWVWLALPCTN